MDGRQTRTDCDEAGDYVVPNVLSPRDLVFRPDNMDETVPHTRLILLYNGLKGKARIPIDDLIPKTRHGRNQHSGLGLSDTL